MIALVAPPIPSHVPPLAEAVVYEANMRAEGPTLGFASLTRRLDSIKSLGVNVLWLMPVQPVGKVRSAGGLGSPYAVADFDAVNPEFGTPDDLKRLVKEAHRRKIAVIIDWVANHTAWDHPWLKNPDWYTRDAKGQIVIPAGTNWNDVADLNFSNPDMRKAMIASMEGWVKKYDIDGFRCDTADFLPKDFWVQAITRLRAKSQRRLLMLAEGFRSDHYAAGFDLTYGWNFYHKLKAIYEGAPATTLAESARFEALGVPKGNRRLRFTSNHDESAWDKSSVTVFKGQKGHEAAFAITALYGGVPLIYNGQEVAWPGNIPIFERSRVDWSSKPEARALMARLMKLRRNHRALRDGELKDHSTADLVAFSRRSGQDRVLVVANVRGSSRSFAVPASLKSGGSYVVNRTGKATRKIDLGPYEFVIITL